MKQLLWRWRLGWLMGLALLVYLPALRAGFIWDDDAYVTANTALRSLRGLWEIWVQPGRLDQYYPLTYSSFWTEYHLWGLHPLGYHVTNVLLHALNSLLVWRVLERLKVRGAWFAGLLFLVHPVMVESVAWITERKNVLSGVFYLSALLSYFRFKEKESSPWPWYLASLLFFIAALLSKTVTGTLPAAIILIFWWKEGRFPWKELLRMIPFFAAAAVLSSITLKLESGHIIGTATDEWTFSFAERCLIAGRALWFYLGKLAWPQPIIFIYPRWTISTAVSWQWYFPAAFLLFLATLWIFRKRWGQGPFTVFTIFAVTLLPALGFKSFFPMRFSFVADHFQYLAVIAPFALVTSGMTLLIKQRRVRLLLGVTVLVLLGGLSWKQCGIYMDRETLWRDTLAKNPNAWMAHNNLAVELEAAKEIAPADAHYRESLRLQRERAEAHYRESLRLAPQNIIAYNNLVKLLIETSRFPEAEALIKSSPKTNHPGNLNNLGALLTQKGDLVRAAESFREAVSLQPDSAEFQNNLGAALFKLGETDEAITRHKKAIELKPDFAGAYLNLGTAYLKKSDIEEAIRCYRKSITFDRKLADAYANLGFALTLLGRVDETMGLYMNALEIDPSHAVAHNNLANFLAEKKQFDQADLHYRDAIRFGPGSVFYHSDYASFLLKREKPDEAMTQYREILKLDPKNTEAQDALGRLSPKNP
ncbi:MAG: tetratricopeptide repeat protein [Candidatus Omnitrophota bacterium]